MVGGIAVRPGVLEAKHVAPVTQCGAYIFDCQYRLHMKNRGCIAVYIDLLHSIRSRDLDYKLTANAVIKKWSKRDFQDYGMCMIYVLHHFLRVNLAQAQPNDDVLRTTSARKTFKNAEFFNQTLVRRALY